MPRDPDATLEKLVAQLLEKEVTDLFGVVDGVAGVGEGAGRWTLLLSLFAWRLPGGSLQERELTIVKSISEVELDAIRDRFDAYDIVHCKARVAEDNVYGTPRALLVELVGKVTDDAELNRCAQQLQKPVTFEDPRFGTFTLERSVNWFEAQTDWGGTKVKLTLPMEDGCKNPEVMLANANQLWDSHADWNRRVLDCAAADLLTIKNECWLDEDETEVSVDQFKARMTLASITVYQDGTFEFWWNDNDLFWGHLITVNGDMTHGPKSAAISG